MFEAVGHAVAGKAASKPEHQTKPLIPLTKPRSSRAPRLERAGHQRSLVSYR
jgi:hypothetical protein